MKEHLLDKRVVQRALQEGLLDKEVSQRLLDALPDVSHKLQAAGQGIDSLSARDITPDEDIDDDDLDDEEDDEDDDDDEDEGEGDDTDPALAGPASAQAEVALTDRAYVDVNESAKEPSSEDVVQADGAYSSDE